MSDVKHLAGDRTVELPWGYDQDLLVAMVRDPRTLFCYWDFADSTLGRAHTEGGDVRPQIWLLVLDDPQRTQPVQTVDIALEVHGCYLHDLLPAHRYRAEIHLLDHHGGHRQLGRASNEVTLPPGGPSSIIADRFLRIGWDQPLRCWTQEAHAGSPLSEEARALLARLSDWPRFSGRTWGGSGLVGRPFSPFAGPSPGSPSGDKEGE